MTWTEKALLLTAGCTLVNTVVVLPLTLLRSCQAYNMACKIDRRNQEKDAADAQRPIA